MARHTVETVLIVLYTLLGVYVLGQIIILLKQRHKPLSYKAVFNWFALAWMFLRALFWVLYISDDAFGDAGGAWFYILFWLPHSVIYLTFATLALFLNKVIKRRNWTQKYRLRFLLAYGIFGLVDVVGTFVLSVLAGTSDDASVENSWESGGGAVLFLLLGAVYMILGYRLRKLSSWEYNRMFMFQPKTISTVTFLLGGVFATRCIFNFLTLAGVFNVDIGQDDARTDAVVLIAYAVWEFFPLILLLTTVAAGPVGTATYQAIPKETLNFGVFGAIDAMEAEGDLDGPPLALGDHNRHENDGMGPLSPVAAGHGMAMPYDYMGQQPPPALPPSAMGAGSMAINSVGGGDGMPVTSANIPYAAKHAGSVHAGSAGYGGPGSLGFGSGGHAGGMSDAASVASHTPSQYQPVHGGHHHNYRGSAGGFGSPGGLLLSGSLHAGSAGPHGTPIGIAGASVASTGGGGLGRPGGFTAHALPAFSRVTSDDGASEHGSYIDGGHGHAEGPGSQRVGSQNSTRSALSLGASGFMSAQQNALRRTTYVAPAYVPHHLAGGRPTSGGVSTPVFGPAAAAGGVGPGLMRAAGGVGGGGGFMYGDAGAAGPHGVGGGMLYGGGMGLGTLGPLPADGEDEHGTSEGTPISGFLAQHRQ